MPFRHCRAAAVVCIAIAMLGVLMPAAMIDGPLAEITCVWLLVPPTPVAQTPVSQDEGVTQGTSYRLHAPFRAPPA